MIDPGLVAIENEQYRLTILLQMVLHIAGSIPLKGLLGKNYLVVIRLVLNKLLFAIYRTISLKKKGGL